VRVDVIRVDVEHLPKPTGRSDKTLSLWWSGPATRISNDAFVLTCGALPSSTHSGSRSKPHSGLATFSNYFPVRHFILAISAPFEFQHGVSLWARHDLLIAAIWGAAATLVALRRFRWSPRRT
jgi:hypothetical protein